MTSNIFHEYDIRGHYPAEVNETIFYNLGKAYYEAFKPKKIAIGRDSRLSSDTLFLYLASALQNGKVKIIDLGCVSTPFCLWYSQKYKVDALMITASHNPKDENGLKLFSAKNGIVDKLNGLGKLETKFKGIGISEAKIEHKIDSKKHSPIAEYVDFIIKKYTPASPTLRTRLRSGTARLRRISKIKIALDLSNGSAGQEFILALEKLKIDFATLNETPNGKFPAHSPNPLLAESQKGIKILLKQSKFSFGAIIDGDGDRILFLDELGEVVDSSYIFSLFIENYLPYKKAKAIVKNIAIGRIVDEIAKKKGLQLGVVPVGRTKMQTVMKKIKAEMGAEKSGHYFFKDLYYGDNAVAAILAMVFILAKKKKSLSKLLEPYKNYIIIPEINIPFEGRVDKILGAIKDKYKNENISEIDGLTVENPIPAKSQGDSGASWRFNLRRSNTESVWRLNLEGKNREEVDKLKEEVENILKS
ncbi:MAG: hypothetical protein Q8Q95_02740 [bacterium]|nr:hypothetical protein [bacterium]